MDLVVKPAEGEDPWTDKGDALFDRVNELVDYANGAGTGSGTVTSITAADATITVGGTDTDPTIGVGTVPAAQVSGLATIATSGSASNLATGTVPTARLGTGTASSSTYLRGDSTWAAGGGDGTEVSVDGSPVSTLDIDSTAAVFNDLSDSGTLRTQLFGGSARTQKPFFVARLSSNLSLTNDTPILVPHANLTIVKDTDSAWSSSNSDYVIPVNGIYRTTFFAIIAANASGTRFINATLNSTDSLTGSISEDSQVPSASLSAHLRAVSEDRVLTAGDIIRFYAYQDSGSSLNLRTGVSGNVGSYIAVEWIRPS